PGRKTLEDFSRIHDTKHARRVVSSPERLRVTGFKSDEDRIAPLAWPALRISLLPGFSGPGRRAEGAECVASLGRAGRFSARPGKLSARGLAARLELQRGVSGGEAADFDVD